jgi:adenine-specific DNA-methyltransferase
MMNKIELIKGCCLEKMKDIEDKSIHCIITSPPYNIGKEYETKKDLKVYLEWQKLILTDCYNKLKDSGTLIYNVGSYIDKNTNAIPLSYELYPILKEIGYNFRQNIVWTFSSGLSAKYKLSGRYEDIMWLYKGDKLPIFNLENIRLKEWKAFDKRNNPNGKNPTNVWNIELVKGNSKEKKGHPCQFPEELINRLILGMTNENDLILDPFAGSYTTGLACINTNRNFIGIEKDLNYFNIGVNRIKENMRDGYELIVK